MLAFRTASKAMADKSRRRSLSRWIDVYTLGANPRRIVFSVTVRGSIN